MDYFFIKDVLIDIGQKVCNQVHHSLRHQSLDERSAVYKESNDDTIFQIDREVESILLPAVETLAKDVGGLVLIAEGLADDGVLVFPDTIDEQQAALRLMIDPIDGTRGIMYDKRSAFFLAGAAPNKGAETSLLDIQVSVMVELPTSRSELSDRYWAVRGEGVERSTLHLQTGETKHRSITPSQAKTILGGYAQISRFFPPGRDILAKIEEDLVETLSPHAPDGRAILFNDQYISSGGQLHELLTGHDRFIADLRGCLYRRLQKEGRRVGMTCHPYDVCAHRIGTEAGLIITDGKGGPLNPPLNTTFPVDWIAYANPSIQKEVEPVLKNLLRQHHLMDT